MARKSDRPDPPEAPTLGARALMLAITELPLVKTLRGCRVLYKRNARGEHVVAVIYPPQPP